ncbi:hypothetical protein BpHYR1_022215 [Brachionus plicatilis]|uniref:Uncharacterized protein n=1 Tax=Brachionus plicatilis TaxID=10195 RepID=A0A3M7Q6Y8_BRAPC|nr:hypothetical protein BpHYR1_022215 [Brachionus plicatilis]
MNLLVILMDSGGRVQSGIEAALGRRQQVIRQTRAHSSRSSMPSLSQSDNRHTLANTELGNFDLTSSALAAAPLTLPPTGAKSSNSASYSARSLSTGHTCSPMPAFTPSVWPMPNGPSESSNAPPLTPPGDSIRTDPIFVSCGECPESRQAKCCALGVSCLLAEHGRHFVLQLGDDVRVYLGETGALYQVVELAQGGVLGQALQVAEQVLGLELEEAAQSVVVERPVPERADVDAGDLGRVQYFAERPHERAVHSHQLLMVDHVGLVEHDADFFVVAAQHLDRPLELVGYVEFVRVEQKQDAVAAFREPLEDGRVVVAAVEPLFFAGQNARRVDERDALEHLVVELRALEAVEKSVAEFGQGLEVFFWVDDERVARYDVFVLVVHHGYERVGGGLGPDPDAREIRLEQVADERGLARRVLAHQQHHRLRLEVRVVQHWRMKLVEFVRLLERKQFGTVDFFEAVDHRVERLARLFVSVKVLQHTSF